MIIGFHVHYTQVKPLLEALHLSEETEVCAFNDLPVQRVDPRRIAQEAMPRDSSGQTWIKLRVLSWSKDQQDALYQHLHAAPHFVIDACEIQQLQAHAVLR